MSDTHWFVRRGSGWRSSTQPSHPMGWLMTAGYSAAVTLVAAKVAADDGRNWPVWAVLIVAMTVAFVVGAVRMSAPAGEREE